MAGDTFPCALHDAIRDRRCAFHAHLLSDDRAHHELEAGPRARHTQTRRGRDEWREHRVVAEASGDFAWIDMQIEHARERRGERIGVACHRALDVHDEPMPAFVRLHFDGAVVALPFDRTPIDAIFNRFDARGRPPRDEFQHARPVERPLEGQFERGGRCINGRMHFECRMRDGRLHADLTPAACMIVARRCSLFANFRRP